MDWSGMTFDWNRARAFLISAEERSLSAAAKAIGCTQSTISRQISALEKELGVALFERGSTGLRLTPNGARLLEFVRLMGEGAGEFSLAATLQSDSLEGTVCISANELMANYTLSPILTRLSFEQPALNIELVASNEPSDILRREADIAVRSFRPTQQGLIARKVGEDQYKLYAAKSYAENVDNWEDYSSLRFVGSDGAFKLVRILKEQGIKISLDNFKVSANQHMAHWQLVRQGAGIGVVTKDVGDLDPLVQLVMPEVELPRTEVWLVAHRELKTSRRVRLVYDYLAAALSKHYGNSARKF